jgi:hypothetical protein
MISERIVSFMGLKVTKDGSIIKKAASETETAFEIAIL